MSDDNNQLLTKAASAIEDLLAFAADQEALIASLKESNSKLASRAVVLEKVASTPALDDESIDKVVDELVSSGYLSSNDSVKCAAEIKKNPNNLLKLASHLIRINNPSTDGAGVPRQTSVKQASSVLDEWELDGWTDCWQG